MHNHSLQQVDLQRLQDMFDTLFAATGIPSSLIDTEGTILTQSGWQDICLSFHRQHPEIRKLCQQSDLTINKLLADGEKIAVYQCPMGLIDSCCPVILDEHHVASVFTGQFFHHPPTEADLDSFRERARQYGFDEDRYLEAVYKVPIIAPERHQAILNFLTGLTGLIIDLVDQAAVIDTSQRKLRNTFTAISDGLWEWYPQSNAMAFSDRCYEMLGYPPQSFAIDYQTLMMLLHPQDRNDIGQALQTTVNGERGFEREFRMRKADLSYIYVLGRGRMVADVPENEPQLVLGTLTDITEKQQLRQAFALAFQHSPILMSLSEIDDGKYVDANQKFYEVTGYTKDAVIGTTSVELGLLDASTRRTLVAALQEKGTVEHLELKLTRADGTELYCDYSAVIIEVGGRRLLLSLAVDTTPDVDAERERQLMVNQLRQAQKLEAIGTLAGGIAHDFNNILGAMIGYADMAKDDVAPDSRTWHDLDKILKSGERAKQLVAQILTFSRQTESKKAVVYPVTVIKEVAKMLRSMLPVTIRIETRITRDPLKIYADPIQLHQVLMNLCTNAYHAMQDEGGVITLGMAKCGELPGRIAATAARDCRDYVQLSVADTGIGIDPSLMDRIFDPFFTTKEVGKGTGMGLAITYGIVTDLGGAVTVDSTPGSGATFKVYLPMTDADDIDSGGEEPMPRGNGETILVVDDEVELVRLYTMILEKLGYKVVGCTEAVRAYRIFEESPQTFNLVITDFTMPDLTGMQLAEKLLALQPAIPILLCTGFSENIDENSARQQGVFGFLYKPVLKREMAVKVRDLLEMKTL